VINDVTGLRVDGASTMAVADALDRLLRDPVLARRLGKQGYARVLSDFSWQQVAQRTRQLGAPWRSR